MTPRLFSSLLLLFLFLSSCDQSPKIIIQRPDTSTKEASSGNTEKNKSVTIKKTPFGDMVEKQSENTDSNKTASKIAPKELSFLPPHQIFKPQGPQKAIVRAVISPKHSNKKLFVALRKETRSKEDNKINFSKVLAGGSATIPEDGKTEITLNATPGEGKNTLDGTYVLYLCINTDNLESWFPSHGDFYLTSTWEIKNNATSLPSKLIPSDAQWKKRTLPQDDQSLTFHYHSFDQHYHDLTIWTWNSNVRVKETESLREIYPVGQNNYGLIFQTHIGANGTFNPEKDKIGIVPRIEQNWEKRLGPDRFWEQHNGNEIWLQGDQAIVYTKAPDTSLYIAGAFLDAADQVVAQLSRPISFESAKDALFYVVDNEGKKIKALKKEIALLSQPNSLAGGINIKIELAEDLDSNKLYTLQSPQISGTPQLTARKILTDSTYFKADKKFGAFYTPEKTTFRLFAPTAEKINLLLFKTATEKKPIQTHALKKQAGGVWETSVLEDLEGLFYNYSLEGHQLFKQNHVTDIYATNTINSSQRARITDFNKTNPPGFLTSKEGPTLKNPTDAVIYELHIRDFTISPTSGISEANRGKYLGWTETDTRLPSDKSIKTTIAHLKELGVTHVQLLPIQDFQNDESAEDVYNWGYITNFFHSPDGWFASNIYDESRITEFKQLIKTLHDNGMGVILDVVYNHTGSNAHFDLTVPKYYFRFNQDGSYSNGSACGNDFKTESPLGRRYIIDSMLHWVKEYGIDGYRLDLMALMDRETLRQAEIELRKINPDILLYGEPWWAAPSPIDGTPMNKTALKGTGYGAYNDNFRDAIKGSPDGNDGGFIQNTSRINEIRTGFLGQQDWAPTPAQTINYMSCHDNLTLYDKLEKSLDKKTRRKITETAKLGYLLLLTAQGVPFIHGGDDFNRTKKGEHNSYNKGDRINAIDWKWKRKNIDLFQHLRDLIKIRKAHPLFRLTTKQQINNRVTFHHREKANIFCATIDGKGLEKETWSAACVLINPSNKNVVLDLPDGKWKVALDQNGIRTQASSPIEGRKSFPPKSGFILYKN